MARPPGRRSRRPAPETDSWAQVPSPRPRLGRQPQLSAGESHVAPVPATRTRSCADSESGTGPVAAPSSSPVPVPSPGSARSHGPRLAHPHCERVDGRTGARDTRQAGGSQHTRGARPPCFVLGPRGFKICSCRREETRHPVASSRLPWAPRTALEQDVISKRGEAWHLRHRLGGQPDHAARPSPLPFAGLHPPPPPPVTRAEAAAQHALAL